MNEWIRVLRKTVSSKMETLSFATQFRYLLYVAWFVKILSVTCLFYVSICRQRAVVVPKK